MAKADDKATLVADMASFGDVVTLTLVARDGVHPDQFVKCECSRADLVGLTHEDALKRFWRPMGVAVLAQLKFHVQS